MSEINFVANIKKVNIDKLIPYPNNARTHSGNQIAQIAGSIREFGFNNPVLIDKENNIIAGHGRVEAARLLNMKQVPAVYVEHLSEKQKKAYILADNKLALNAEWDNEILKLELDELMNFDFDTEIIGFSDYEISNIFLEFEEGETDANEEWEGMPEFQQDDITSFRKIIVHFENQEDVDAFADLVNQKITEKTKFIWHPAHGRRHLKDSSYENEADNS